MRFRIADIIVFVTLVGGITTTAWELHTASGRRGHSKAEHALYDVNTLRNPVLFAISDLPGDLRAVSRLNNQVDQWLRGDKNELIGAEPADSFPDPWGRPYRGKLSQARQEIQVVIISSGKDGIFGNADDIYSDMKSIPRIYDIVELGLRFWVGVLVSVLAMAVMLGRIAL